jgi:hypothetical protein
MLYGHVDEVSHQRVQGWAADDTRPDEALDISIFVDGRKVAQVMCDRRREDLAETGQYGSGNHGFVYRFAEPLPTSSPTRLSVRFSLTGAPLGRGDCLLIDNSVRFIPPARPLVDDEPVLMPSPRDTRALFELLYWYDERLGLSPMLRRLDIDGCEPWQLHYSVFGRLPETPLTLPDGERYYPHDHLNEMLLDEAFQADLLPLLLHAYKEKQRSIFLHIPKCAGTDLSNKLKTRYPWMDFNIMDARWTSKDAMLRHLSRLVTQLRFADRIYLCGHALPNYYLRHGLVRPVDQVFTVVRHPFQVMMSQVNYVLTRFWIDGERGETGPDVRGWLELIGIDELPSKLSEEFAQDAGMRVLRNTDIVKPNSLCYWLGGDGADAHSALNSLIALNVEVTDTNHYGAWLAQRWKIHSRTRDNPSMKFFEVDNLPRTHRDYMRDISGEDLKLYQAVDRSIEQVGRPSSIGRELFYGMA